MTLCFLLTGLPTVVADSNDSIPSVLEEEKPCHTDAAMSFHDRLAGNRLFRSLQVGVPLIAGGLIEKHQDNKYRRLRNDFLPEFKHPIDNYLQVSPLAVMVGLKALGVPSRSSWTRMMANSGASFLLMSTTVQSLKHTTNVWRPDGADNHSFPSGHTATAFMAATLLSKEYGHLSPWVSIGAYSVAATTGFMRIANNKHWLSDVMVGAGLGIISTEFGYWIVDALMKDKGLLRKDRSTLHGTEDASPSFFGVYGGFNVPISKFDVSEEAEYKTSTGTTLGAEGAWFFNSYLGLGGRATLSNFQFIVNDTEAGDNTLDFWNISFGPYFNLPLTNRLSIGTKALAGYTHYMRTDIGGIAVPHNAGWGFGTGLNVDYRIQRQLSFGIFMDYSIQPAHSEYSDEFMHIMTVGARAAVMF